MKKLSFIVLSIVALLTSDAYRPEFHSNESRILDHKPECVQAGFISFVYIVNTYFYVYFFYMI